MPTDPGAMGLFTLIKELAAGGFATFLVAILIAGQRKIWVWGYVMIDAIADKDKQIAYERAEKEEWKTLALEFRDRVDRSLGLTTKVVEKLS